MRLLADDLFAIRDREARKRGAIAVLEGLGFAVQLERAVRPPGVKRPKGPSLKIVSKDDPDKGESHAPD